MEESVFEQKTYPHLRLCAFWQWLQGQLALQRAQAFLWAPIFLSIGIGFYFSLPFEPPLWSGVLAALLGGGAWFYALRFAGWRECVLLLALIGAGFLAAQIRTAVVYTPVLQKDIDPVRVEGEIAKIEDREDGKGIRVVLRDIAVEKLAPVDTPRQVRLSFRKDAGLALGQRVTLLAALNVPSPPVAPGSFDFRRHLYFQGIGAVGFVYRVEEISHARGLRFSSWIENLRQSVNERIEAVLPYPAAGIAKALTTGERLSISEGINEDMRASGLAHILSISGLHIGLYAAIAFFFTRLLMAAVPRLALHHPIKKYAAVLAFLAALFYTLLSGSSIPAQRTLFMVAVAFFAILIDRSPLSLRLLAFAAFSLLLLFPESLISASFHMSFGAVMALIVFYDALRERIMLWYAQAGWLRKAVLYLAGSAATSFVASTATAPFTLFHFQQMATYSVLANMLAVPVVSFLVMPSAAISLFLMPLHLEYYPLQVMRYGIDIVLRIAANVADLPFAAVVMPAWPLAALLLLVLGFIALSLWQGRLRWFALIFFVLAWLSIALRPLPDILVSSGFDLVGIRRVDGGLTVSSRQKERFARESWEKLLGLQEGSAGRWPREGADGALACDAQACRAEIEGRKISILKAPDALAAECAWADLILAEVFVDRRRCAGVPVYDPGDGKRRGAIGFYIENDEIIPRYAEPVRGMRPWSIGYPGVQ